jgi:hypothetical protein
MTGFLLRTKDSQTIRFKYDPNAPITVAAFHKTLPFTRTFMHARVSGQEIWTSDAPKLEIIQENASVFTEPGEVVIGPANALRTKTAGAMGIYYGEGKGLDACNIFAKVVEENVHLLKQLGEDIWRNGEQVLRFEAI